jgi:hypothetical protein
VIDLLRRSPDFPEADQALFWLAEASRADGNDAAASGYFRQVAERFPKSRLSYRAWRSLGDMETAKRHHSVAVDLYRLSAGSPDPDERASVLPYLERAESALLLERITYLALLALLGGWAYLVRALARIPGGLKAALYPLPETWVSLPCFAAILAVAWKMQLQHLSEFAVLFGVAVVSFQLSGALLRRRSFAAAGRIAFVVISLMIGLAVLYGIAVRMEAAGMLAHALGLETD